MRPGFRAPPSARRADPSRPFERDGLRGAQRRARIRQGGLSGLSEAALEGTLAGEAWAIARAIASRQLSPVEAVDCCLRRVDALNPGLNAFCLVLDAEARQAAVGCERQLYRGVPLGPLHGVPVAIKDMTAMAGV